MYVGLVDPGNTPMTCTIESGVVLESAILPQRCVIRVGCEVHHPVGRPDVGYAIRHAPNGGGASCSQISCDGPGLRGERGATQVSSNPWCRFAVPPSAPPTLTFGGRAPLTPAAGRVHLRCTPWIHRVDTRVTPGRQ